MDRVQQPNVSLQDVKIFNDKELYGFVVSFKMMKLETFINTLVTYFWNFSATKPDTFEP